MDKHSNHFIRRCSCGTKLEDCGCGDSAERAVLVVQSGCGACKAKATTLSRADAVKARAHDDGHSPVQTSELGSTDVVQAAWSDEARKAAAEARRASSNAKTASTYTPDQKAHMKAWNAHKDARDIHESAATYYHLDSNGGMAHHHHEQASNHTEQMEYHMKHALAHEEKKRLAATAAEPGSDDAVQAAGTSEGAKKGWLERSNHAWSMSEKADTAGAISSGRDFSAARHEEAARLHTEAAKTHREVVNHALEADEPGSAQAHGIAAIRHDYQAKHHTSLKFSGAKGAKASEPGSDDAVQATWSDAAREGAAAARRLAHDKSDTARKASFDIHDRPVGTTAEMIKRHRMASDAHFHAGNAHDDAVPMHHDQERRGYHKEAAAYHYQQAEKHDRQIEHLKRLEAATKTSETQTTDAVHCRGGVGAGAEVQASEPWSPGKTVNFMWMPGGIHTVCAGFRDGWVELTVKCDERSAKAAQASLDRWRAERPEQEPYGCVEHREQEASVRVAASHGFRWNTDGKAGVYLASEPTSLGADNVNGKIHRSWSPSFFTDADYSKAKPVMSADGSKTLVFPEGVRGSRSNPAEIIGVDFCVGTLTNKPAFHAMAPVKSAEGAEAVQAEGTSEGAKKGWQKRGQFSTQEAFDLFNKHVGSGSSTDMAHKLGRITDPTDKHLSDIVRKEWGPHIALQIEQTFHKHMTSGGNKASEPSELEKVYAAQAAREEALARIYDQHGLSPLELIYAKHGVVRAEAGPDPVTAAGTSEGAKKGWDGRRNATHLLHTKHNSGTSAVFQTNVLRDGADLETHADIKGVKAYPTGSFKSIYIDIPKGTRVQKLPGGTIAHHQSGQYLINNAHDKEIAESSHERE